jgi:hypothetical protein
MLDVVLEDDQHKELAPHVEENEVIDIKGGEILKDNDVRHALKRKRPQYYDKQQQLELVFATQKLFEFGEHDLIYTNFYEEDTWWTHTRDSDIWKDITCMKLLHEGTLPNIVDLEECKRARKRILNYHWQDQRLYFKGLFVPRPEY